MKANEEGEALRVERSAPNARLQRVGKYRIDEQLGRGAFGIVYKGHDELIDRVVAVKTLRPEVLADLNENAEALKRFGAEVRSAGRCLHPNIVTVFDYVEEGGAPYIIMEYVPAGTLDNVIKSGARLPIRQIRAIMEQLLLALDHAHAKGVIHRDVKPSNILCHTAGSIKVADFGTAHIDSLELTRSRHLEPIGTPYYSAPERFLGRSANARGDVYSAGVILYQLLTGQRPFTASDIHHLMNQVINQLPPSVLSWRDDLWDSLDEVVQRALARNPDDRYPSALAFLEALNAAIDARAADRPPLDLTACSMEPPKVQEQDGSASPRLNQSMVERLKPETLAALERTLAPWLGPMAKILVKRAASECTDAERLLAALLEPLKSSTSAAKFGKQAEALLRADQLMGAIRPEEIEAITAALLPIIGPFARPLVARLAKSCVGSEDFYSRLANELPKPQDREALSRLRAKLRPSETP
jgi:eukaryotic-like serine/threonine-protein kinase